MAFQPKFTSSKTPAEVTGLTDGTTYEAQNKDQIYQVEFTQIIGAGPPDLDTDDSKIVEPLGTFTVIPVSGESIWVWTRGVNSQIAISALS